MKLKNIFCVLLLVWIIIPASGQQHYSIHYPVIAGGGTVSSSVTYTARHTFGQYQQGTAASSSYSLQEGIWEFYAARQPVSKALSVDAAEGWNMISIPLTVSDSRVSVIFPSGASAAFAYSSGYVARETLRTGSGYWLKFGTQQNIELFGYQIVRETVAVSDKWNMIGSISVPLAVSSIVQQPEDIIASSFFGYDNGYYVADTLEPGKAYWVKTDGNGSFVLNSSHGAAKQVASNAPSRANDSLNTIFYEDISVVAKAKRRTGQLVFGVGTFSSQENEARFEMPPSPPTGATDIRFASNRYGAIIPETLRHAKEYPLQIQSRGSSLKLAWKMSQQGGLKYKLVEKKGKRVSKIIALSGNGSAVIMPAEDVLYALRVEPLPVSYALMQNYPNPFNPSTVINYTLPADSRVTVKIYNITGQVVAILADGVEMDAGVHELSFQARELATGVYFYRLEAETPGETSVRVFSDVKKMLLVK